MSLKDDLNELQMHVENLLTFAQKHISITNILFYPLQAKVRFKLQTIIEEAGESSDNFLAALRRYIQIRIDDMNQNIQANSSRRDLVTQYKIIKAELGSILAKLPHERKTHMADGVDPVLSNVNTENIPSG